MIPLVSAIIFLYSMCLPSKLQYTPEIFPQPLSFFGLSHSALYIYGEGFGVLVSTTFLQVAQSTVLHSTAVCVTLVRAR